MWNVKSSFNLGSASNLTRHEYHTAVTFPKFVENNFSSQELSEPARNGALPWGVVNSGLMAGARVLVTVTINWFDLIFLV